jgi:hypothetical protein
MVSVGLHATFVSSVTSTKAVIDVLAEEEEERRDDEVDNSVLTAFIQADLSGREQAHVVFVMGGGVGGKDDNGTNVGRRVGKGLMTRGGRLGASFCLATPPAAPPIVVPAKDVLNNDDNFLIDVVVNGDGSCCCCCCCNPRGDRCGKCLLVVVFVFVVV